MTDLYVFKKSELEQSPVETPYESKIYNYIQDLNNSVYQNNGLTLVQFDLGSIYNSKYFNQPEDWYLAIPLVMVYAVGNGSTLVTPAANTSYPAVSFKGGFWNLVDKCEIELDGKTIEQMSPYTNQYVGIKMLSQMTQNDLIQYGSMLNLPCVDSVNSMVYDNAQTKSLMNNYILGNSLQSNTDLSLNANVGNDRLTKSIQKFGYSAAVNAMIGNLTTLTQAQQEGRPTYQILNTNYGVYYDTAIIRMRDIFDSFNSLPLVKKVQGALRLYLNTGAIRYTKASATTIGPPNATTSLSLANSTFSTTCPITINQSACTISASAFTDIYAGCFVGTAPVTSINSVNLGASNARHPTLLSCRLYYSQVEVKPQKALEYVSSNRSKRVCYNTILTSTLTNIPAGSTFSQIVQSGIVGIRGVIIVPFISTSVQTGGLSQWANPLDTCPMTTSPLALTNLNVQIGGMNVFNVNVQYGWEQFIENTSQWENITNDFAVGSVGLFSQDYWNNSRVYFVDCSRGSLADNNTPRNVVVNFTNSNNVAMDALVFVIQNKEFSLDVETGLITMK